MLTGGHVADCTAGAALIEQLPDCDVVHADKGYDSNAIRSQSGIAALGPASRPRQTANGKTSSRRSSTAAATPSSACSAA
jgi:hypothetical protein